MNSHFNRQFIMLDFRLLGNRDFLKFLGSSEFATYLVLRSNIWRSPRPHHMGLDQLYEEEKELACSLTREKVAAVTGIAPDNISRHLSTLAEKGVIRRRRTGRQSIFVLGEWVDVLSDGSYRLEWFYMEGCYGISKSDLTESVRSGLTKSSDQNRPGASGQTRRSASDNNREENREIKPVPVNGANSVFKDLPNLTQPKEKTEFVAERIVEALGDRKSLRFYRLIAAKAPEDVIYRALSEARQEGDNPAKLFTHKMKLYALSKRKVNIAGGH